MGFAVSITVTGVTHAIDRFEQFTARITDMRPPLRRTGHFAARNARERLNKRPRSWHPHTGILARSITVRQEGDGTTFVETRVKYAGIQQRGGRIVPKHGKMLAIPIPDWLARSGQWPRDFPHGHLKLVLRAQITIGTHSWTGKALAAKESIAKPARRKPNAKRPTPRVKQGTLLFALVKGVTIIGRRYIDWTHVEAKFLQDEAIRYITHAGQSSQNN